MADLEGRLIAITAPPVLFLTSSSRCAFLYYLILYFKMFSRCSYSVFSIVNCSLLTSSSDLSSTVVLSNSQISMPLDNKLQTLEPWSAAMDNSFSVELLLDFFINGSIFIPSSTLQSKRTFPNAC